MACGAAVVSTRSGGVEDFLRDRETSLLVSVGDAEKLAAGALELLENEALRCQIAAAGLREVAGLTLKGAAAKLEALLERLVLPVGS
jgi:glycosyltransferase involved in cell wall biosynthesis